MRPRSAHLAPGDDGGQLVDDMRPRAARLAADRSDRAIAELAAGQHGVLTIDQLAAVGLGRRGVSHRAAGGRLTRVHTGVYAVGTLTGEGRWMAAVLACGKGAVLSHRSAAELWGIGDAARDVDVMVSGRAGRSRPGIAVHRGDTLTRAEVTVSAGIPCTTPSRTLVDFAAVVDRRTRERAIDRAEELRLFDLDALQHLLERHPRRRGARMIAQMLRDYTEPTHTRSAAEERMLQAIAVARLPQPRTNVWIALDDAGYEADFLWADVRLVVEVDGRAHHARRSAFVHDRRRDRKLALAGYAVHRFAAAEVISNPTEVTAEIRALLAKRQAGS
jgi:very-short-patch-repair endonuclease